LFGLRRRDGDMGCAEEMEMMHRNKKEKPRRSRCGFLFGLRRRDEDDAYK